MRVVVVIAAVITAACSSASSPTQTQTSTTPTATATAPHPPTVHVPPQGSTPADGGCGGTPAFAGGTLPSWATVNAPSSLPYVVASPAIVLGYIFTSPLKGGAENTNKILWYVWTQREGPLTAAGHPLGSSGPVATFSKAADSGPGEIYPSGPSVPSPGCWQFTLTWQGGGGRNHAEVDLSFE